MYHVRHHVLYHVRKHRTCCSCLLYTSKEGKVESINGNDIAIKADSICVHGDNPKALEFVKNIRETLIAEGVEIKNLSL